MGRKRDAKFQSIGKLLLEYDWDKKKYITQEFQDYGYRLAMELSDEPLHQIGQSIQSCPPRAGADVCEGRSERAFQSKALYVGIDQVEERGAVV